MTDAEATVFWTLLGAQSMSTPSRKTILLVTDQQQSVLNALAANQPHPIAYSPYGHRPRENGLLSLLGFNGELLDPVTGHYHLGNGYRQFNPVLMRFNSPDSWSPFGKGGLNAYGYCGGDPTNRNDPTGHLPNPIKGIRNLLDRTSRAVTVELKSLSKEIHKVETVIAENTKNLSKLEKVQKQVTPLIEDFNKKFMEINDKPTRHLPSYHRFAPPSYEDATMIEKVAKLKSDIGAFRTSIEEDNNYLILLKEHKQALKANKNNPNTIQLDIRK